MKPSHPTVNLPASKTPAQLDQAIVWHPYSSITNPASAYLVERAENCKLHLADGRQLVDGMSSWWSVIHGYNHPVLNQALRDQIEDFSHVMFGGLTHRPAIELCQKLVEITPQGLDKVFLSDSGSVAVEVAMKMALQYWQGKGKPDKTKFACLRGGYHGDTLGAMSVCDPITGMHKLFSQTLQKQHFIEKPHCKFHEDCSEHDLQDARTLLRNNHQHIAALILEPVVQGAGGMYFYSPDYLKQLKMLCEEFHILLIADEIATGFGRTGKLFACEHAGISPDILCLGKAMTGGYMTLAATLCSPSVADGVCSSGSGAFMHGPTFMGNALACAVALASIKLLLESNWQTKVLHIEKQLDRLLSPAATMSGVHEVRVLGAIGVIELDEAVDMAIIQPLFVDAGIWVRPFGNLVYVMPPFIIDDNSLEYLGSSLLDVLGRYLANI
ncbi:MAG: adenosylmethionine--8-amino-7-oxononanoate transaminase [Pseudomonadales bacterium]|nr:adenosylmethionine--8-amino-7-oxononanoate transaminase [Pseudomonadales bacterium]